MSSTNVFNESILKTKIKIQSKFLNKNYQKYILKKLQDQYEGKFTKFGLIKKDTIKILTISLGKLEQNSFEGNILYDVSFNSKICNPVIGDVLICDVINTNNFGILCSAKENNTSIIDIIIPKKSIAVKSDIDLSNIKIGENVYVEIIGKKPILNDTKIKCIGKIIRTGKLKVISSINMEEDDDIIKENDIEYDEIVIDIDDEDDSDEEVVSKIEDDVDIDSINGGSISDFNSDDELSISDNELDDN